MTDKEWKELCDWVESLKNKNVKVVDYSDRKGEKFIYFKSLSTLIGFYKNGYIKALDWHLIGNHTSQQIKSIIENLL